MVEYLGEDYFFLAHLEKPHSETLLDAGGFYLGGRSRGGVCNGILATLGMRICGCLICKETFQGAHGTDVQNRGGSNSAFTQAHQPILQDKLEECGESVGGVNIRGGGELAGDRVRLRLEVFQ